MRDINIVLEPFNFISIIDCKIYKSLNNHSTMTFTGRISSEEEKIIMNMNIKSTAIKLKVFDENGESINLFFGSIKNFRLEKTADSRVLYLDCISNTYFMDVVKKTRIFQDVFSTYEDLLNYISGYSKYEFIMNVGNSTNIEKLIVQYNETDFEFIKRLASHFNSSICPAYLTEGVKYFFGIPESSKNFSLESNYTVKKELIEDLRKDEEQLPFSIEQGATIIEMISRNIYEIGDYTIFNGQKYVICKIDTNFIGNELKHTYILKEKLGQYISKYYNSRIIGASLSAKIEGVSSDKVKINVIEDGIQNNKIWFSYSTVYSSPDGTGWYCMPESGDSVRLYFPTEKEHHGYVISAVHVSKNNSNTDSPLVSTQLNSNKSNSNEVSPQTEIPRSNPDNKSLKSKYGKEVLFTPKSVIFTNNNGMTVEILDDEGISIISDKKVNISSEEQIDMTTTNQSINLKAAESIIFEQLDSKIEIKDDINVSGAKVKVE